MPVRVSTGWKVTSYVLIFLWLAFAIVPLFWLIAASVKSPEETNSYPPTLIPRSFSLSNFWEVLQDRGFGGGDALQPSLEIGDEVIFEGPRLAPGLRPFWNSLRLAVVTTVISIAISTMAGYVLAVYRFPLRGFWRGFVLLAQQIPIVLLIVPLFLVLSVLNLAYTFWGVALALIVLITPFNTWLMLGYFRVMPVELIDSARIDGAGQATTFFRVMLPLAAPGLATAAIFSFTRAWNEFLLVLALSRGQETLPYTVNLYNFFGEYGNGAWHLIAAAALMASLPVLIIFSLFQKYFIAGLTGGAVKS